ncbi:tyrosine-type recombinase/integrase [Frateuria aurantia]|uniref:Site-specific recombinase XerD n=1 Tax=Frateuria aurantia (strain ATCC 33424 / DSM 6220 / KCTC 2777 / LMG 1558 / NBRC 3245 / NCIMB 13370) TaxID=767434 RepID=H8L686_FRAAD|nr:site-specific integrase [Frateuria aurantia]AFC85932.1 site-specific recombinase XerD [Frateuria aurantia DSM 6220]
MASIFKHGKRWRAQVLIKGQRKSKVFVTKAQASAWAIEQEAVSSGRATIPRLVSDALERYEREVAPTRGAGRWEVMKCRSLKSKSIAKVRMQDLDRSDIIAWRDERLQSVTPATMLRELNMLRAMFRYCREEWFYMNHDPIKGMQLPDQPDSRKRRITQAEVEEISLAFGLDAGLACRTSTNRIGLAFLFAIETAMRSGEITALTWDHVHISERYAHLPKTKNGDARDVPLSSRAIEILEALPRDDAPCFQLSDANRDALWRKVRNKTTIQDLHFHDSRAEAIWRLSKKLDVLQLARAIGHRDLQSLMIYYRESASDMASKLD